MDILENNLPRLYVAYPWNKNISFTIRKTFHKLTKLELSLPATANFKFHRIVAIVMRLEILASLWLLWQLNAIACVTCSTSLKAYLVFPKAPASKPLLKPFCHVNLPSFSLTHLQHSFVGYACVVPLCVFCSLHTCGLIHASSHRWCQIACLPFWQDSFVH